MSDKTGIDYVNATWNPVVGCTKISAGCQNCYAERMAKRLADMGVEVYQHWGNGPRSGTGVWNKPLYWKRPRRILVCSMGDLFHAGVTGLWLSDVLEVARECPRHRFLLLTKRPWNAVARLADTEPVDNIWIGTSMENADAVAQRLGCLVPLREWGWHTWASFEPLLEGPGILRSRDREVLRHWVEWAVVGCESGPGRRPCPRKWVGRILWELAHTQVPTWLKQVDLGGKVSKDPQEWPAYVRMRELPEGLKLGKEQFSPAALETEDVNDDQG